MSGKVTTDDTLAGNKNLELSILRKVGKILSSGLGIDQVLTSTIDACRELLSAEAWSILLIDQDTKKLVFSRISGQKKKELTNLTLDIGKGIAGKVAQTGKARIVNDVKNDPDFFAGFDKITKFDTRSILCIPLISRGKVLGVIEIINKKKGEPFSKIDLKKVETYTEFASIALDNALLYEQAVYSSITDDLTGMYNNRFIHKKLAVELEIAKQKQESLGFIFIDLDRFKNINDKHGHLTGSGTLRAIAAFLKKEMKEFTDMIARYGGDEFLIVIPRKNARETCMIAEQLRKRMSESKFKLEDGTEISTTASFGVSAFPDHADKIIDLIGMADKAMYEVKADNRNGVKVYSK